MRFGAVSHLEGAAGLVPVLMPCTTDAPVTAGDRREEQKRNSRAI
jgi:hypothetical protein